MKLTDCCFSVTVLLELNDTGSTRPTVWLVLDLGALDLTDCGEQLDQVLIAGRPRQVAHVDDVAGLSARASKVGERVGCVGRSSGLEAGSGARRPTAVTSSSSSEASSSAKTASEAAAAAEPWSSSPSAEAATKATTGAEAAATPTEASRSSSKAVVANLEVASLPLVAIELVDGVSRIVHGLESNDARALGATIRSDVDVGAENGTSVGSLAEEILQVLPANIVGELGDTVSNRS
jgi:hypothetical protein